jgi:hypothetical protein
MAPPLWAWPTSFGTVRTRSILLEFHNTQQYRPFLDRRDDSSQQPTNTVRLLPAIILIPIGTLAIILTVYYFLTRDRIIKPPPPPPPPPPPDALLSPFKDPGVRHLTSNHIVQMSKEIQVLADLARGRPSSESSDRLRQLESHLTCPMCGRFYHHPVSLISANTNQDGQLSCRKSE